MRPLLLKMKSFGSYKNYTEINMDSFGSNGLYLITGATGSGKSTIINGIVYALYGKVRGRRDDIRSKDADDLTDTVVELTFMCNGRNYNIVRRMHIEGSDITEDVKLSLPDGREILSAEEVNEYIIKLIGLTYDEYVEVCILSVENSTGFLLSDPEKQRELLRDIFDTGKASELQLKLIIEKTLLTEKYTEKKHELLNILECSDCENADVILEDDIYDGINNSIKMDSKSIENVNELKRTLSYIKEEINSTDSLLYAMSGNEKLNVNYFEIFIQNNIMKDIVSYTNQYLSDMTNNRFLLKFDSDLKNADMFEISVFDNYSSTIGNIKEMSGGEMFLISLSFILGLSDKILAVKKDISLDAIFIDEGFGLLDRQTLDQTVRILQRITRKDKLIGMISHVSDLYTMITKKIIVNKGRDNNSVITLVTE